MKKHFLIIALMAAVALNPTASAATQQYLITLEPEGGGGRTGGGSGTITFDDTLSTLTFKDILWSGLSAPANNAHMAATRCSPWLVGYGAASSFTWKPIGGLGGGGGGSRRGRSF
jgi:hypothetical protein